MLVGLALLALGRFGDLRRMPPEVASATPRAALALGVVTLAGGVLAWFAGDRRRLAPVVLSLPLVLAPQALAPAIASVAETRSTRALSAALRGPLEGGGVLIGIETFAPSLNFYLGRQVRVDTSTGLPFGSNYVRRHYQELVGGSSTLAPPGTFWKDLAACERPVYLLLKPEYATDRELLGGAGLPLVYEDRRHLVLGPCRRQDPPPEASAAPDAEPRRRRPARARRPR
jgi:hypothetical protein